MKYLNLKEKISEYQAKLEHAYSVYPEKKFRNNPESRYMAMIWTAVIITFIGVVLASRVVNTTAATMVYPDGDPAQVPEEGIGKEIILQFTGDIMCHDGQLKDAEVTENRFIFDRSYTEIRDIISSADLSITTFDGVISTDELGYSGHPDYFTPIEFVRAASTAGTDIISMNSANADNAKKDGITYTKEKIDHLSTALWNEPVIKDVDGVKVALVPVYDSDDEDDVGYNIYNKSQLRKDLRYCKDNNADYTIAYIRWESDAGYVPTEKMRTKSSYLLSIGFDMVVGGGNRSVLPAEVLTVDKYGDPGEKKSGIVFYSLGNMLSNQRTDLGDVGAIVNLRLRKISSEKTKLVSYEVIPTYTNVDLENGKNFRIVPVVDGGYAPDWMDDYNKDRYSEVGQIVKKMIGEIGYP